MLIEICVNSRQIYESVKGIFGDVPNVIVSLCSITQAKYPVLISPGNSFGEMNGGVDGLINTHLSGYTPDKYIQEDVKGIICKDFVGELPVGQSIVVKTQHPVFKYLIYTPTMRVAEDVSGSLNAYLAFRGALLAMLQNGLPNASTPLFCTGAGCMNLSKACQQMKEAYITVMQKKLVGGDWPLYHSHHRFLTSL
jgi:O-acetyl-ADP-ribose deacetylase (regulator of RNase III)